MTTTHDDAALILLKALADPTRLRLLRLLAAQREGRALCVHALADRLGISQPAASQHLGVLRELELVRGDQVGVRVHYYLNRERLEECRAILTDLLSLEA